MKVVRIFLFLFALFSNLTVSLMARDLVGRITYVKGRVDIISLETSSRRLPKPGQPLYSDEQIRTSSKSMLRVVLADTSRVAIYAFSVVNVKLLSALDKTAPELAPLSVRMLTGKIHLNVVRPLSGRKRFELETPTMVAGVRGTEFAAVATLKEARLVLYEGSVEVANRSPKLRRAWILRPRQEVVVKEGMEPLPPRYLDSGTLDSYLRQYEITKEGKLKRVVREPERFLDKILRKKSRD